ncbi:MAG: hypothetical protein ACYC91_03935 [Solirubrobacteraceae bacterium]
MQRRLAPLLVLALAMGAASCGSSGSSGTSSSGARATELSYFGADTPFVMTVATDPSSPAIRQAQALSGQFPIASFGQAAVVSKLRQLGIDYTSDIRPLLGNPLMLGVAGSATSGPATRQFLAVWVAKDAGKLAGLVRKIPGLHETGTRDGATLYSLGSTASLALDGATALAGVGGTVVAALDRHAHGGSFNPATLAQLTSGLPADPVVEMFGRLAGVLSTPRAARARRVPWVAALRGYAVTISAGPTGLRMQYRIDTGGASLSNGQLPIAPGASAPELAGSLPITVGISGPQQMIAFAEQAEQFSNPPGWAAFERRRLEARTKTGVDVTDLLKLLSGPVIIASDTHTTLARVGLNNGGAAARILAKLMTAPRDVLAKARSAAALGDGFYAIREPRTTLVTGVLGHQLVLGRASMAQLRAFAAEPASPAPGAQGSVAFRVALTQLVRLATRHAPPAVVQTVLGALGDLTGWVQASPAALTGLANIAIR